MGPEEIALVRDNVIKGGYVGRLVANDYTAAMVTAELLEVDPKTEEAARLPRSGRSGSRARSAEPSSTTRSSTSTSSAS